MTKPAQTFKELIVWQKAHEMVLAVYKLTQRFPSDEKFGLTSQLRRAAVSVAANIAEGFRKRGLQDKVRFLNIAQGSLEETHYYLILATDLDYADCKTLIRLYEEVGKLLNAYAGAILNSNSSLLRSKS